MKREDFIATIGFKDDKAIVDTRIRSQCKKLSVEEMFREGYLKPAVAAALFDAEAGDESTVTRLLSLIAEDFGDHLSADSLRRIYGISRKAEDITSTLTV